MHTYLDVHSMCIGIAINPGEGGGGKGGGARAHSGGVGRTGQDPRLQRRRALQPLGWRILVDAAEFGRARVAGRLAFGSAGRRGFVQQRDVGEVDGRGGMGRVARGSGGMGRVAREGF